MTTLADKAILSGADNRPPMLEKDMYDSWKSRMELYMMNRQHGRMILESVENGPLLWPTIKENGVTRPKKYSELSATEAIQADCDVKATNIILQGLLPESSQYESHAQSSTPLSITYPLNDFQSSVHHNVYNPSSSIPQVEYAPSVHQQSDFSQPDSDSCAQSMEIDNLRQTLSEHLKEKESLKQTVAFLKNDFQKEESRNIDRELALEKQVKEPNNIVFKRNQFAQTVHMLTKPQFFYDHTTRQALGFLNPFYLKKAQQFEPKLYDGSVIQKTIAIVIRNSEETLMLEEESRSKML
nr:hypothetical protein [Tanacetum cinerariifolium]